MTWSLTLTLDEQIYPLRVVQRAAYSLAQTLSILIRQENYQWVLEVNPNEPSSLLGYGADAAKVLLIRHLNDFNLRDQIALETSGLRELLASTALKECGL
ncbi:His-Xaa-Ser system protein HxsD [Pseudomonas yamanorum]|jgi:His-Xaa-Ser system protein HxsD|uniref:His-Xaa-Ser system protein HxsD n=1 Tax=Pseudomonas yamanorum TaxID=515393 RepID=UPI001C47B548|nr:His-Xaa-Ser system protein HxsD [Pseudomonas yamanorum]MBV6661341.1 His-Xaa-Ser system protein HxsD [Pseudomonas yamanorum]